MAISESSALRAEDALVEALRRHLLPMAGMPSDHDALLALIGSARFALLGEASHGTREFYRERIAITQRLIAEKGFRAVAVEAREADAGGPARSTDSTADIKVKGRPDFDISLRVQPAPSSSTERKWAAVVSARRWERCTRLPLKPRTSVAIATRP